jgi:hypothetical protein
MLTHKCTVEGMRIVASRPNPLDQRWSEWTLVICPKCRKLYEWQHQSEEQMHGGDLEITALPTPDYIRRHYELTPTLINEILAGRLKTKRFNRYSQTYVEEPF